MTIFNLSKRDIHSTIEKIRATDKSDHKKEQEKALQQQQEDIEGKYYLQLLEERCKNQRLQERIDQLESREKLVKEGELENKKTEIRLHQLIVGLVDYMQNWHKDRSEELHYFLVKQTELKEIETALKSYPINPALIEDKQDQR